MTATTVRGMRHGRTNDTAMVVPGCAHTFSPTGPEQSGWSVELRHLAGVCDFGCWTGKPESHPKESDMNLQEMMQERKAALDTANAIITVAERADRGMTTAETENYNESMAKYKSLGITIGARNEQNTILKFFRKGNPTGAMLGDGGVRPDDAIGMTGIISVPPSSAQVNSPGYKSSLLSFLRTGGKAHNEELTVGADGTGGYHMPGSEKWTRQVRANGTYTPRMRADLGEGTTDGGSGSTGGFAIDVQTSQLIVPLGMPDLGVFNASNVIPTATNIKIPQAASFGTSVLKSESVTGSVTTFGGTDPALEQTELGAFMIGAARIVSWELLQDVPTFQEYVVNDLLQGQRITEGGYLATGTGTGQPLGLLGNTGTGTGAAVELTGTASTDATLLLGALFDVTSTLKGVYQPNASWIMPRATGLAIRRAQMSGNLYIPVATVDPDGTERILGKPVFYDVNFPALPTATNAGVPAIVYGDFKQGNIIGVRGGAGINVKILDQPLALEGQLAILAYRRIDARIRRSEAMQQILISHS